jgi:alkaline phosphatase D
LCKQFLLLAFDASPLIFAQQLVAARADKVSHKGATDLMRPARRSNDKSSGLPGRATFLDLGPLLGDVGPSSAKIWAKATGGAQLSIRLGLQRDLTDGWNVQGPALDVASDFMGQVQITNLQPAHPYYYCVLLDGKPAMIEPYPSFRTAPAAGRGHLRFAFGSCVGYHGYDSAATWGDMASRTNFDLLLMLGDNHYADTTDPEVFLTAFGVQRRLAGYAEISRRTPQYAIWDNHDYGPEPCDGTAKNKERSLAAFKRFWPNPSFGEAGNPGVYHKFSRSGVEFFMLDNRYHRSPNGAVEDGHKTHLGEAQLAWLKRGLVASTAPAKVLAIGGEWESSGIANSWTSFKRERDDVFKFIEEHGITGVLLLSGDRHFTAAYQVNGKYIEVSSGPFGSKNSESKPLPEMFWYSGKGRFYSVYDIDTTTPEPKVVLEIYKTSEGLVERRAFTWDEVLGVAKIKTLTATPARDGVVQRTK